MSSVPSQYTVLTPKGRLKIEEYYLYRLACITYQVKINLSTNTIHYIQLSYFPSPMLSILIPCGTKKS